jgi:hypothetical protein
MNHSDIITRLIEQARNKKKRCQNTFPKGLANAPFLLGFIGSCCCRCTIVWQSVEPAEGTLRNGRRKAEKLHEGLRKRGKRSVGRNLTGTQATEAGGPIKQKTAESIITRSASLVLAADDFLLEHKQAVRQAANLR